MTFTLQIERQPGQQKIEKIIRAEMSDPRSPSRPVADNLRQPRTLSHIQRSGRGGARHPSKPRRQPQKAGQSEYDEERPPAKTRHQSPAEKNAERRSQRLARSDDGIGEAALALHEMVRKNLGVSGISH